MLTGKNETMTRLKQILCFRTLSPTFDFSSIFEPYLFLHYIHNLLFILKYGIYIYFQQQLSSEGAFRELRARGDPRREHPNCSLRKFPPRLLPSASQPSYRGQWLRLLLLLRHLPISLDRYPRPL